MNKDIKDYLHLYLGCEVWDEYNSNIKTLYSVTCDNVVYLLKNTQHKRTLIEIKPILRPLSDMTEDEFKEAVLLFWNESRDIIEQKIKTIKRTIELKQATKYGTSIPFSAFSEDGSHYLTGTLSSQSLTPKQFKYLLSIGIDLFGLIESGLAIDKTKLPTP